MLDVTSIKRQYSSLLEKLMYNGVSLTGIQC